MSRKKGREIGVWVDGTHNAEQEVEVREKGGRKQNGLNENVKISEASKGYDW